ncbi:MAG TPA: hypothetical protein PK867_09300, partial [Pirellulales bacterium]|nr:hypothetical protein [Pirellulales bacterium]
AIHAAAFSPDGRLVATAADVSPARVGKSELAETLVWDVASGLPAAELHWHRDCVSALAFSPDGCSLVTASRDHTISVWNVERGLWDAVMGAHEQVFRGHQAAVTAVAFSPDGAWLASAAADQTLRLWDAKQGRLAKTIDAQRSGEGRIA